MLLTRRDWLRKLMILSFGEPYLASVPEELAQNFNDSVIWGAFMVFHHLLPFEEPFQFSEGLRVTAIISFSDPLSNFLPGLLRQKTILCIIFHFQIPGVGDAERHKTFINPFSR